MVVNYIAEGFKDPMTTLLVMSAPGHNHGLCFPSASSLTILLYELGEMLPHWVWTQDLHGPSHWTPSSVSSTWRPHLPQPHSAGAPYICSNSDWSKLELESEEISSNPFEARLRLELRPWSKESLLSPFWIDRILRGTFGVRLGLVLTADISAVFFCC